MADRKIIWLKNKLGIVSPTEAFYGDAEMNGFREGQYIIYQNGDTYEIGKIKRLTATGAFVWYSCGDTAAKTPYDCMHPIQNAYVIGETGLGGCMT